jgi:hypothetical protein
MHRRSYLREPLHQLTDKAVHMSFDPLRIQKRKSKIEEFKTLVSKYYTPQNADQILRLAFYLYGEEDDDFLNGRLAAWLGWILNEKQPDKTKPFSAPDCFEMIQAAYDYGQKLSDKYHTKSIKQIIQEESKRNL